MRGTDSAGCEGPEKQRRPVEPRGSREIRQYPSLRPRRRIGDGNASDCDDGTSTTADAATRAATADDVGRPPTGAHLLIASTAGVPENRHAVLRNTLTGSVVIWVAWGVLGVATPPPNSFCKAKN